MLKISIHFVFRMFDQGRGSCKADRLWPCKEITRWGGDAQVWFCVPAAFCSIPSTFQLNILSPTPRFPNTVPGTLKYACPENFRKYDQDGGQQVLPSSEELG